MIKAWEDARDLSLPEKVSGIARYWLAYGSAVPAAIGGAAAAVASGSRWTGINATANIWAELGAAFLGIRMEVSGEAHVWSTRPCVFLFNHQSAIDVLVCARLLRRDTFGIAKQEARRKPVVGRIMGLMGTVFIDRADREKAIAAMKPAVDEIKRGRSMLIAPEGTRSPDGKLGPFKKGAFHVAMAAGAPLVPIVIHDAWKRLRPGSGVVRPGTVHVTVLPPIPTRSWKAADLDRHIAEVRHRYLKALGQVEEAEPAPAAKRPRRRASGKP
jgi:putative phosphoserine phosphatase/1-acylglycerol-3-phosphate O-acyltransferase